jgi:hypothetical protein
MPLIGSIVLDDIHNPCDLATALRLLLVDHLDRDEFGIENPDSPFTQDGKLNYRFCGDETSFVLGFETGRGALRVDVRQVDYDEPAEAADSQDQDQDLTGQTGDETRLVAAYRALKIPLGVALRRLENEPLDEEPAEPPAKAGCCEGGQCRFGWRKLFGASRSSPSPTTRTPDQVKLGPGDVASLTALPEIQDPVLARLIDEFRQAEDESDRLQGEASAAEDRYQDAGRMLAEHFAANHAERNPDGSLIGYREFVYRGRSYRLEEATPDRRPFVVASSPRVLTV